LTGATRSDSTYGFVACALPKTKSLVRCRRHVVGAGAVHAKRKIGSVLAFVGAMERGGIHDDVAGTQWRERSHQRRQVGDVALRPRKWQDVDAGGGRGFRDVGADLAARSDQRNAHAGWIEIDGDVKIADTRG
jgi:hypothetical protein